MQVTPPRKDRPSFSISLLVGLLAGTSSPAAVQLPENSASADARDLLVLDLHLDTLKIKSRKFHQIGSR